MRAKFLLAAVVVLAVAATVGIACGGGGNGDNTAGGIRTQKGLNVAAIGGSAAGDTGLATDEAAGQPSADFAPGSPPVGSIGVERSGLIAPDIAPYPYPSFQSSQDGLTVQGYGSAAVDADSAVLEFWFGGEVVGIEPGVPDRPQTDSGGETPPQPETLIGQAQPITEAELQPIVDAIAGQGVSRDDIEVIVQPSYGDPYYRGSAIVRATVGNVNAVDGVVSAVVNAAGGLPNISLQSTSVSYTVSDCAALERAAMQAAVEDARERGQAFASVLGVGLGAVVGASNYSYAPYGGAPCDSGYGGVIPLGGVAYAEGQAPEVELFASVVITFAIQ